MDNYEIEQFLLKIIDRIDFKNDVLFFAVDNDTSYKALLREYIFISCENRILREKNEKTVELLERWLVEYGNMPVKQSRFFKRLESIERKIEQKEQIQLEKVL